MDDELEFELALDSASHIWGADKDRIMNEGGRKSELVIPRQVLMYYSNYFCNYSQRKSAEQFGLDRTTFFHSKKCIKNYYQFDKKFRNQLQKFLVELGIPEQQFIFSLNN